MTPEPDALVRGLWEAIDARDYAAIASAFADDCDWVSMPAETHFAGPQAMIDGLRAFHDGFPDGRSEIVGLVAAAGVVVVEWRMSGTNSGSLNGQTPTGRHFERRGCSVAEVRDGAIVAYRDYFDRLVLAEQLGETPAPARPTPPPRFRTRRR